MFMNGHVVLVCDCNIMAFTVFVANRPVGHPATLMQAVGRSVSRNGTSSAMRNGNSSDSLVRRGERLDLGFVNAFLEFLSHAQFQGELAGPPLLEGLVHQFVLASRPQGS